MGSFKPVFPRTRFSTRFFIFAQPFGSKESLLPRREITIQR
jgi:hypothetical protein